MGPDLGTIASSGSTIASIKAINTTPRKRWQRKMRPCVHTTFARTFRTTMVCTRRGTIMAALSKAFLSQLDRTAAVTDPRAQAVRAVASTVRGDHATWTAGAPTDTSTHTAAPEGLDMDLADLDALKSKFCLLHFSLTIRRLTTII